MKERRDRKIIAPQSRREGPAPPRTARPPAPLKRGQPAPRGETGGTPIPRVAASNRPRSPTGLPGGAGNREARGGRGGRNRASGQSTARCGAATPPAAREGRRRGKGSAGERRPPPAAAGRAPFQPAAGQALTRAHPPPSEPGGTRSALLRIPLPAGSAPARSLAAREKSLPVLEQFSPPLAPIGHQGYPIRSGS